MPSFDFDGRRAVHRCNQVRSVCHCRSSPQISRAYAPHFSFADFGRPVPACLFEALEPAVTAPNLSAEKISPAGNKAGLLAAAALQIFSPLRSSAALRPLARSR
jgi:hypothetical protein